MTPTFLLETSFVIDFLQTKPQALALMRVLEREGELGTNSICLGELYEGALYSTKREISLMGLDDFINGLNIIWDVDISIAKEFGRIRGFLRKEGIAIDDMDTFIAATCLIHDATLVTFNQKHFRRIPGLKIYEYKKEKKLSTKES